jgi:hypothetical protein
MTKDTVRTPTFQLTSVVSAPYPCFSITGDGNFGHIMSDGILLNRWYHIAYTLSDSKKRMDFYIDGEWVEYVSIPEVRIQQVIFNDAPLFIGNDTFHIGFNGQIRYISE